MKIKEQIENEINEKVVRVKIDVDNAYVDFLTEYGDWMYGKLTATYKLKKNSIRTARWNLKKQT